MSGFKDQCSAVVLVAVAGSLHSSLQRSTSSLIWSETISAHDHRFMRFTSIMQVLFVIEQLWQVHVDSHSTLLSPLSMRSQRFNRRMQWTVWHRLWRSSAKRPADTVLWTVLFSPCVSWPKTSPAVRVMNRNVPWQQARDGMNCSGSADLDLNTV